MCDDLGVPMIPVPADAHFSHGKVERRVGFVKVMAEKVFKDMNVCGAEAARVAGYRIGETCCRLCNNQGFSPAQWVLGEGVHLPASLADLQNDPVLVSQVQEGSAFWQRLRLQESCEVAFHQAANSSALRRAVLARTRPQPGPFERGTWVHYWRSRGGKRQAFRRWHGPARVIGRDQHGYWVIHN